jgi:very-short-patch-repair endonuclease
MSLAELSQIWKPYSHQTWVRKRIAKERYATKMRNHPTSSEAKAWTILQEINQTSRFFFRRQCVTFGYIIDFYCHPLRLGIEIDGSIHEQQQVYDEYRELKLRREGIRLLHFSNSQVFKYPEQVKQEIIKKMEKIDV